MIASALEGRYVMKRIRLHENFANEIAAHGIGMNEMAEAAGIGRATLFALLNPQTHPKRVGGMYRTTAWKIVNAFAAKTGVAPKDAWNMLMVEVDETRHRRKKSDLNDQAE